MGNDTVIGNAESIRHFASALQMFADHTAETMAGLGSRLREMEASQEFAGRFQRDYQEEFEQLANRVHQAMSELLAEDVPYLYRVADKLDEIENL